MVLCGRWSDGGLEEAACKCNFSSVRHRAASQHRPLMRSAPPEGAAAGPVLVDGVREDDKEGLDLKYSTQECIFVLKAYTILYSENPESTFLFTIVFFFEKSYRASIYSRS